jgi:inorganic pyrophosphatase
VEHLEPFPEGTNPERDFLVNLIVETPRGIRHKFAYETKSRLYKLKSTIAEGLQWPYDFGFVPGTRGDDGDPLDILFLNDEPTFPGCFAEARLLGIIRLAKNGTQNDRLVACAKRQGGIALSTDPYERIRDLPQATVDSLKRFLIEYSEGAGNDVRCTGIEDRDAALKAIREATLRREG